MSREAIGRLRQPARWTAAVVSFALCGSLALWGQNPEPVAPPAGQTLTADQLDDLAAPIALYPDPLLSQILVASTYPLEVVEAGQWLQKNSWLTGSALTEAAQEQNWDPSVQALVVFPDVVKLLTEDVTWTTNLGNAFLAQQTEVMAAVQTMRQRAEQNSKLASTPEETVSNTTDPEGQPAIDIEPANPDMMYVPEYDPAWIWGQPVYYPYPEWYWPSPAMVVGGLGFGFYPGIDMGFYFGLGWGGWGAWGWHPAWGTHAVVINNTFIHRYNWNTSGMATLRGTTVWSHNPIHRQGVPYTSGALNSQYRQDVNRNLAVRPETGQVPAQTAERMGNRSIPASAPATHNGSAFSGAENGRAARTYSDHGYSSMGPARSSPARSGGGGGGGRRR